MIGVLATEPQSCQRACVASILELPLKAVPDDYTKTWEERLHMLDVWLYGVGFHLLGVGNCEIEILEKIPCYAIATVPYCEEYGHAVVIQNGKVVWDPSPDKNILHERFLDASFLVPLQPERVPSLLIPRREEF